MVVNIEENEEVTEEERKQGVREKAEANKEIDTKTAAVDKENKKIVDIDEVIAKNPDLMFRINNLQKIGIGMEYIRTLVALQGNYDIGDTEQILEESINTVFNSLVRSISEDRNGIVLNDDGTVDPLKSLAQIKEMAEANNARVDPENPYKLKPKENKNIFDELYEATEIEKITTRILITKEFEKYFGIDKNSEYNIDNVKDKDGKNEFMRNANVTAEEEADWEKAYEYTSLDNKADVELILKELYLLRKKYSELLKLEKSDDAEASAMRKQLEQELEETKARSKESKYFDEIENLGLEEIIEFHKNWEHERSESQIAQKMSQVNYSKEEFNTNPVTRAKVLQIIARAYMHKDDDTMIAKSLKEFLRQFELDENMTLEDLMGLINSTEGMPKLKKIDDIYTKIVRLEEISEETSEAKYLTILKAVEEGKGRNTEYDKSVLGAKIISELQGVLENDKIKINEKSVIIMSLYKRYYEDTIDKKRNEVLEGIESYMTVPEVRKFLDMAVRENSGEISIFDLNGSIDITKINYILSLNKNVEKEQRDTIRRIRQGITIAAKKEAKIENRELTEAEIKDITDLVKNEKSSQNTIKKKLNSLGSIAITQLRELQDEKVDEAIDVAFDLREFDASKFITDEEKERINIENKIIAIEARIMAATGTSQYNNALKERNEYYKKDAKLREKFEEYRQSGVLSQKVEQYRDHFMYDVINDMINGKEIEDLSDTAKKNYTSILLAGLSNSHQIIREQVQQAIQLLYPDIDLQIKDQNELKKKVFQVVLGKEFSEEDIEDMTQNIINNVIILETDKPSKVSDLEMDAFFQEKCINLEEDRDFTKSELQKRMDDLGIEFSDSDRKTYIQLKNKLLKETCLNNKEETEYHEFIVNVMNGNSYNTKVLLEKNPHFSKLLDKKGNIKSEIIEKEKDFQKRFMLGNMLDDLNQDIISNKIDNKKSNIKTKESIIKKAVTVYEYSKAINNPEIMNVVQKICIGALKKIESPDRKFVKLNENNEMVIDENNVLDFYKKIFTSIDINNYKELVDKWKTDAYREISFSKYLQLDKEDFEELNGMSEVQKMQELKSKASLKNQQIILRGRVTRRFNLIQKKVASLNENELKELLESEKISDTEKSQFIAIWHCNKEDKNKYQDKIEEIKNQIYTKMNNSDIYDLKEINDIFGNNVFSKIIEKGKNNKVISIMDDLKRIKYISKDRISSLDNVNINAIWYSEAIKDMKNRGLFKQADALSKEFDEKFEKSGKSLNTIISEIEKKVTKSIDGRYLTSDDIDNTAITSGILQINTGVKENDEMMSYAEISKKYYDKKFSEGFKELELVCSKTNNKLPVLANLYGSFLRNIKATNGDKYKFDACLIGMDVLKTYLIQNKGQFSEVVNEDESVDFEKLKSIMQKDVKFIPNNNNIIRNVYSISVEEERELHNAETVFEYINSNVESDHKGKKAEEALLSLYKNGNLTAGLHQKVEEKNSNMLGNVIIQQKNAQEDTFRLYMSKLAQKTKKATGEIAEVITGKRSAGEVANKVVSNVAKGSKRLGRKISYNLEKFREQMQERANKKRQDRIDNNSKKQSDKAKALGTGEKENKKAKKRNALPPGEIETPIRNDSADKVNSNQQSFVESITVDNKGGKIENEALSALSENRSQNSDQIKSVSQEHDEQ